jgi:uncharacterized membrane protein
MIYRFIKNNYSENHFQMRPEVSSGGVLAYSSVKKIKTGRIESIDLLRGIVMIIMAVDHVRDYFHADAFLHNPEDLNHTNIILFFTRWITHFCAPVFVFLAGTSAYLYGGHKTKKELSLFLFTRGLWLVFAELVILSLFRTFNPSYHFLNLQVIWVIGVSMIFLSAMIYMKQAMLLVTGILLIACHNILDNVHVPGNNIAAFLWALLHDPGYFKFGYFTFHVHYPAIPWIGIIAVGYCAGSLFARGYDPARRRTTLLSVGLITTALFIIVRYVNAYGDFSHWSVQKNVAFTVLSFLNLTKYPPSFLYALMTLGPALTFLAIAEKPLNGFAKKIMILGRVPMFYYLLHIFLIHLFALVAAVISGYKWSDMILTTMIQRSPDLKGYGFNLLTVYLVWIALIFILYPICKWYDQYKKNHRSGQWWLSYI